MSWHSIELRTRKYAKRYGYFYHLQENMKIFLDTVLDSLKAAFRKRSP